jgi:hypothetical protein
MPNSNTIMGYTTVNNKFEVLYDKDLAKHDIMLYLNTDKGELDYDPTFGISHRKSLFKIKNTALKMALEDEIRQAFNRSPVLNLISLVTVDLENGYEFITEVSYLEGIPELWSFTADVEKQKISLWGGNIE